MQTQIDRIEQKLDALTHAVSTLIDMIVEEDQDQQQALDLDGNSYGGTRDENQSL